MAETMEKALDAIFNPQPQSTPAIIRSVDELLNPPVIQQE
jgi:hypothetical protein